MSYKTILVHANDKRRAERLLEPAVHLANQFNAHLHGLHVYATLPAPPIRLLNAAEVLGRITAEANANSEAVADAFARATAGRSFTAKWECIKVPHVDLAEAVMGQGRSADLIIAGQTDPDWDMAPILDFPERLALESGRPVLVIPYAGRFPTVGNNVVIAWKERRESARAVFDALPLLKSAKNVHILQVNEDDDDAPESAIAEALARHGIKPAVRRSIVTDLSVGDEILSRLTDLGADLLVMGAYGHSRMRELVFGGVTRHIAHHMTVPTLLSH